MNDDDFLDNWEAAGPFDSSGEGGISFYALAPLAAVFVSLFLVVFTTLFANRPLTGEPLGAGAAGGGPEPPVRSDRSPPPSGGIAPLFSPSVQFWAADIIRWAAEWDIHPNLAATVMQIESCGHPGARSSAGALGLFQVMPYHFQAGERGDDPETNAYRGLSYLSRSLAAHNGDVNYALAGYNAGIGGSQRGEANWPAETKRYTYWGTGIYQDALAGRADSARLNEWLARGGAGLCDRAAEYLGLRP